jgi:hypothetical protein
MANSNIASIGRFSSQMLTYLGTQKTVKLVSNVPTNTFKYSTGPTIFPNSGSLTQSALGFGVVGNYSPNSFDSTKCFFLSRGVSPMYADTMAALAIDMSFQLGITTQALLDETRKGGLHFNSDSYRAFNNLRDPGNQVGTVTTVDNRKSLQARQIRF